MVAGTILLLRDVTAKLLAEYESRNSHPGENIDTPKADLEVTTQHRVASRESGGVDCSNCSTFCSSLSGLSLP